MENSDIIAIIAIIGGVITTVATSAFTYFTNKESLQTKRYEISFQKRVEAFSAILECLMNTRMWLDTIHWIYKKHLPLEEADAAIQEYTQNLRDNRNSFFQIYFRNRVYLPNQVDDSVYIFAKDVYLAIQRSTSANDFFAISRSDYDKRIDAIAAEMKQWMK